jgi:16S rRNA (cytosine967-C5)-methyltransferase
MQILSLIGHTQELLAIILKSTRPADSLIDTFFRSRKYLGSHDRRFIAETTYGTLRHLRKCEYIISSLNSLANEQTDDEKSLLLILVYLSLHGKLDSPTCEQITEKVGQPILDEIIRHTKNISLPDSIVQRLGLEYSFPDWMVERFIEQYGEMETEKICSSLNEQAPLTIRVNTLKTSVEECQAELNKQGILSTRTMLSPFGLNIAKRMNVFSLQSFRDGWFEVQDEGSQILPLLIDPKPNAKLLDVCAGAGGKTLEFAALMKNRGEIFATDINNFRLEELRKRSKRAGAQNVRVKEIQTIEDLSERYTNYFDIVFVDAPCSGLGTIRRNPGMKWMVTQQTIDEVSQKQRSILELSLPLMKQGGRLVYATCTLPRQENEDIVESFLAAHTDLSIVSIDSKLESFGIGKVSTSPFLKLLPHLHGTDGFFCAVLEKQSIR